MEYCRKKIERKVASLVFLCVEFLMYVAKDVLLPYKDNSYVGSAINLFTEREKMVKQILSYLSLNRKDIYGHAREREDIYIYGGYVRDSFAKLKFNDIDVRFPCTNPLYYFVDHISKEYNVQQLNHNNYRG